MTRHIFTAGASVLLAAAVSCGCGDDGEPDRGLHISIRAEGATVSPTEHVLLQVDGENLGESRVVWGRGSSSCQLTAYVRAGRKLLLAPGVRACTDDLSEQGLDAGRSRHESWAWDGAVLGEKGWEMLPPGMYEVHGAAGDYLSGNAVIIRVVEP